MQITYEIRALSFRELQVTVHSPGFLVVFFFTTVINYDCLQWTCNLQALPFPLTISISKALD